MVTVGPMNTPSDARLSLKTIFLLTLPPLLWSGNAVVGRMVAPLISPMTLNVLRWTLALLVLLPLAPWVLRRDSPLWVQWKRFAVLGSLSIASYNALLYLALTTSSPMNVTLVGASTPVWMLLIGRLFFGTPVGVRQLCGAALSIGGVLLVLCRGDWELLVRMHLVAGPPDARVGSYPCRLGCVFAGSNRVWLGGSDGVRIAGMDRDRHPFGLGLAAGPGGALHWRGASRSGLPLLGRWCGLGRPDPRRVFHEPHAVFCGFAIRCFFG